jgi:hypothetical protein
MAEAALVERFTRRSLTEAERRTDVLTINRLLNRSKDELQAAVEAEQARVARARARGRHAHIRVTARMWRVLDDLFEHGRRHATAELSKLPARVFVAEPDRLPEDERHARLRRVEGALSPRLHRLDRKVSEQAIMLGIGALSQRAIVRALVKIPGARDAAGRVVSSAFNGGLAHTFEQADASGLVSRWAYSAVLDKTTCDVCQGYDGEEYGSWAAIQEVLPDGGPNGDCLGDGRCRCRAVVVA